MIDAFASSVCKANDSAVSFRCRVRCCRNIVLFNLIFRLGGEGEISKLVGNAGWDAHSLGPKSFGCSLWLTLPRAQTSQSQSTHHPRQYCPKDATKVNAANAHSQQSKDFKENLYAFSLTLF